MILQIYSVRDNAAGAFLQPFFSVNNSTALRALSEAVNDPKHEFHKHASDYSIWHLGSFDDADGSLAPPTHGSNRLLNAVDLLGKD